MKGKRILHFAPEPPLRAIIQPVSAQYVTADYLIKEMDLRLDITQMTEIATGAFDVLIACDVLEHVPDDRRALREIYRVLSNGGCAILTVPQPDHMKETIEDPSVTNPEERLRRFGQIDHVRLYGDDFKARIESAGFTVTVVNEFSFPAAWVKHHVLFPPFLSSHPHATNYRRVYFARK